MVAPYECSMNPGKFYPNDSPDLVRSPVSPTCHRAPWRMAPTTGADNGLGGVRSS
jgi:hypothetical protein